MKKILYFSITLLTTYLLFSSGHWAWGIFTSSVFVLSFIVIIIIVIGKAATDAVENIVIPVIVFSVQQADAAIRDAINIPVEVKLWWESLPENDREKIIQNAKGIGKLVSIVNRAYGATHPSN